MDLIRAIEHADRICGWQENLTREEMPPDWMWHLETELEAWFEEVDAKRRDKYGGDTRDEVPTMQNEYADRLKK